MVTQDNALPKSNVTQLTAGDTKDSTSFAAGVKKQLMPFGSSGTEVFSGYFAEEYLRLLRGKRGAKIWDEMRRSEPQVAMLLAAMTNPIKSANWTIEAAKDSGELGDKIAEHMKAIFFDGIDFEAFLHEALTFLPYGFSAFEVIHNVVFNHPKFGTFNGLKAIAFRSQKTVERWIIEPQTGKLVAIEQYTQGDTATKNIVTIPGDFLVVFSLHKEGDNYEGISALRAMYGAWFRKNLYLKIAGIGAEKSAIGTPIGKIPSGKAQAQEEINKFKEALSNFAAHESSFILVAEGWDVDVVKNEFDASSIKELLVYEDTQMINSVVANFLALGMNGGSGAYALGTDLSDFFLSGIQNLADLMCGVLNRKTIPDLVKLNYGPQQAYPKMTCTGINDKAGKELSEIIKTYVDSKVIKPDDKLDAFVREQHKLPAADPTTARNVDPPKPVFGQFSEKSESRLQLDEKYRKQFNDAKDDLKTLMQENLESMLDGYKGAIRRKWKSTEPSARIGIASQIECPGVPKYKAALKEALAEIANAALDGARKEVPKAKTVQLSESIQLAAPRGGYFDALSPKIKKIVAAQASLIADSQAMDLEKIVGFTFTSSAGATDDLNAIMADIDNAADPVIEGSTSKGVSIDAAAGDAVAQVTNQTRLEFFFDPEVFAEIESFTFVNEDPISEICQEMNGVTLRAGDPDMDTYATPLHHNCKSRWVPNSVGDKGNPEIDRGVSVSKKALKSMTLHERRSHRCAFKGDQK